MVKWSNDLAFDQGQEGEDDDDQVEEVPAAQIRPNGQTVKRSNGQMVK